VIKTVLSAISIPLWLRRVMDEISFCSFLRTSFRKGYVRRINRLRNKASRNPVGRTRWRNRGHEVESSSRADEADTEADHDVPQDASRRAPPRTRTSRRAFSSPTRLNR
jgi:hypothetical protein